MSAPATPTQLHAARLEFTDVSKSFPQGKDWHPVLERVNFSVEPGEIISIVGSSGCGKSTLLRAAAGLGTASGGTVRINGEEVYELDSRVSVGFQEPRLLPWRSISKNVALGLPRGTKKLAGEDRVKNLLSLVGLSNYAHHRPQEISGGMAQRASLARALARTPGLLLLDEPFGALDALTRINMQELLLDLHAQNPTTILLVTHDVEEALFLSDRVVVLGKETDGVPASVQRIIAVPGSRPRNRSDSALTGLRNELLVELGVDKH